MGRPPGPRAAVLALVALAAPAPAAATPRAADAAYLAHGPNGLALALVVHAGRPEAYACDGTARRAFFRVRAVPRQRTLRNGRGDRLTVRACSSAAGPSPTRPNAPPRRCRAAGAGSSPRDALSAPPPTSSRSHGENLAVAAQDLSHTKFISLNGDL